MIWIAGLGNPGGKYEGTRHNLGFWVLDSLVSGSWSSKGDCLYSKLSLAGQTITLVKPQSYMNVSGAALRQFQRFFKLDLENLLVVHDELDLAPGRLQFRVGGSPAGNNGIKSIYADLGSKQINRLRVGIGHPRDFNPRMPVDSWVLSRPGSDHQGLLEDAVRSSRDVIEAFILDGEEGAKKACRGS